jgi:hypothetical protein
MSHQARHGAACAVDELVTQARAALLRRCVADCRTTPAAIEWAAARLLESPLCGVGPDGAASPRSVTVALTHLSAQRTALDSAYEQVAPHAAPGQVLDADTDTDALHRAYLELLRKLPANPGWCCDEGAPCVDAAKAQLLARAKWRRIDAARRVAPPLDVGQLETLRAPAPSADAHEFRALYARLRSGLPVHEHPKLERFVVHVFLGVPHESIARESGMSHGALRKESSRMAIRVARLLESDAVR